MFYLLMIGLCLSVHSCYPMSKADQWAALLVAYENEQAANAVRVAQLVDAINERKKERHEKIARLILRDPFPVQVTREQFEEVRALCKPEYEPVLAEAISKQVISAQMFYVSTYKVPVNLLFEAMRCAQQSKKISNEMRFATVVTLLNNGANANLEGGTYEDEQRERYGSEVLMSQLPLNFAQYNPDLFKVLLKNGAKPTGHIALSIIFGYKGLTKTSQEKLYQSLQHLLDYGVDVTQSCCWSSYFTSPLEYARVRDEKDLIKLFEEHLKKQSTK